MLSVRFVRTLALMVCAAGIAGMIVTSILNHNGAAVTFGLITAVAVLCAMVAKAVAADTARRLGEPAASGESSGPDAEVLADLLELQVQVVVATGAAEEAVRQLVGEAVRFGRALGPDDPPPPPERSFASGAGAERRRSPHAGNV